MKAPEPDIKTHTHAIDMLKRRSMWLKFARAAGLAAIGVVLLAGEVRLAGLVALVLGGALLLIRDPLSASRFYAAEKFILTDEEKRVRAILGIDEEKTTLRFFTPNGQTALDLSASSGHADILLAPGPEDDCAHLYFDSEAGSALTLRTAFGETRMGTLRLPATCEHLAKEWAPGPFFSMKDANGRERVSLSVVSGELGHTTLDLAEGTGKAEASFYVAEAAPCLEVKEQEGFRTLLGRSPIDGRRGLVLFDKDGEIIWQAP
jgi:hypothetical protein